MMYKAVNGKIALQIPEYVKPKQKRTREYHPINIYPYNPYEQYLQIHFLWNNWLYPSGTHLLLE